jgi:hypothetical protein
MREAEEERGGLFLKRFLGDRLAILRHKLERYSEGTFCTLLLALRDREVTKTITAASANTANPDMM